MGVWQKCHIGWIHHIVVAGFRFLLLSYKFGSQICESLFRQIYIVPESWEIIEAWWQSLQDSHDQGFFRYGGVYTSQLLAHFSQSFDVGSNCMVWIHSILVKFSEKLCGVSHCHVCIFQLFSVPHFL